MTWLDQHTRALSRLTSTFSETDPSITSVKLIGSWDAFASCYAMERDVRRGRGQWKGCHSISTGAVDSVHRCKQNGALRMGHTYYYFYELDGAIETYDSTMPFTTTCPFLPGQAVNTLHVATERSLRSRSASLNCLRMESFRTMNPLDRYITPKPAPHLSDSPISPRLATASCNLSLTPRGRSSSPQSWKRLFNKRPSSVRVECGQTRDQASRGTSSTSSQERGSRCFTSSAGVRARDMSPDSLRRFLSEEHPYRPVSRTSHQHKVDIPEDVEDLDDDENFATSAASETSINFPTLLSPPPSLRAISSNTFPLAVSNSSNLTLVPGKTSSSTVQDRHASPVVAQTSVAVSADDPYVENCRQRVSLTALPFQNVLTSPLSPASSASEELPQFYDSHDDDDAQSSNDGEPAPDCEDSIHYTQVGRPLEYAGYSLAQFGFGRHITPILTEPSNLLEPPTTLVKANINPAMTSNRQLDIAINDSLGDFATEFSWMVSSIGTRYS